MKVLSLFDGMSCARIALTELGIPIEQYYASEIDKHAIKQTQLNFPDTIQLGDVTKWKEWDIDWSGIDLLLAGSPCQGFSFAGKQLAFDDPRSKLFFVFIDILNHIKKLNPDVLFLLENVNMKKSHMRIISEYCGVFPVNINSNLVSAQNRDRWYWTNIRTKQVGLFGEVYVDIPQPEDKGIFLRDILEDEVDEKYYVSQAVLDRMNNAHECFTPKIDPDKTGCLSTGNNSAKMSFDSGTTFISVDGKAPTQRSGGTCSLDKKHNYQFIKLNIEGKVSPSQDKSSCFTAGGHSGGYHSDMDLICVAMRGREDGLQHLEPQVTGKTNCLTSVQKDNLILQRPRGNNKGGLFEGKTPTLSSCAWEQNNLLCERQKRNLKSVDEKAHTFLSTSFKGSQANGMTLVKDGITLNSGNERIGGININDRGIRPHRGDYKKTGISELGTIIFDDQKTDTCTTTHVQKFISSDRIRRLTPTECARLQTVPAWYRWDCSDTQIYKMLGNGWTIDAIVHLLSFMRLENN